MTADDIYQRVRRTGTLTATEVATLARAFFKEALERDETMRRELRPDDPTARADVLDCVADDWLDALKFNDMTDASRLADQFLASKGLALDKSSSAYNDVCRAIARAMVEVSRIGAHRTLGDYSVKPEDPMFFDGGSTGQAAATDHGAKDGGELLSTVFEAWKKERKPRPKTLIEWDTAFRMFNEIVGDKPIRSITKDDIRTYKDTLLKVPSSMSKRYRGLTVPEVLKAVGNDQSVPRLAPASVNKYLTAVGSVFSYGQTNGYTDDNPTAKLRVIVSSDDKDNRRPYSYDELQTIFSWPVWTGCASKSRRKQPGPHVFRDSYFWLPLLALFTGGRAEELAQAHTADVREIGGVAVLDINDEGGKILKSRSSRRVIPIHSELIRIGFLDYVEKLRRNKHDRLFPDLRRDGVGKWSSGFSKWYSRYQREMGITDRLKVFHSFRHNFRDALRGGRVDKKEVADALMGHADPSMGGRYGEGLRKGQFINVLAEAIEAVEYPGLDLGRLHKAC